MNNLPDQDAAVALAKNVVDIKYTDLPQEAVSAARNDMLDTLAVAVSGSSAPGVQQVFELVKYWGGREQSTILVYGGKVPAPESALIFGTMAHSRDFDDYHPLDNVHVGSVVVPAAFAIAEQKGNINGSDFLAAVALGQDVMCRIARAVVEKEVVVGFQDAAVAGYFGAAATAGKLLGLDAEEMVNAFGIAYSQASGNRQATRDGRMTKRIQLGLASRGGVFAAFLAQRGFTGTVNSLEGPFGLLKLYYHNNYDPEPLTEGLGRKFRGYNLSFKPYPCGGHVQPAIDATLELVQEHEFAPDNIERIILRVGPYAYRMYCQPSEVKLNPRNLVDGQFSMPYGVATAICDKKVGVEHFTDNAVRRPEVLRLLQKVTSVLDPEIEQLPSLEERRMVKVEIQLQDGNSYSRTVRFAKGTIQNPMSFADIAEKLKYCAIDAAMSLSQTNVEEVISSVKRLEDIKDVGFIPTLLVA